MAHSGRQRESKEEIERISQLIERPVRPGEHLDEPERRDAQSHNRRRVGRGPYNAQVAALARKLPCQDRNGRQVPRAGGPGGFLFDDKVNLGRRAQGHRISL